MGRGSLVGATAVAWLCLAAASAHADEARPWADGVPAESQERATALFDEANELHRKPLYREARAKYEEALALWDHPSIHYNLVLVLVRTDQPLEAYEHVQAALRFDGAALEPAEKEQALLLRRSLERQVLRLIVTCEVAGATVMLDGKLLFTAPGREERVVLVGEHSVSATAPGYVSRTDSLVLPPGKPHLAAVTLQTIEEATTYERRWTAWKPWVVAVGGAGLVLIGVPLELQARAKRTEYETAVDVLCASPCPSEGPGRLPDEVENLRTNAFRYNRAAIGAFVIGGVGIAAGLALAVLNRPRAIPPTEHSNAPAPPLGISVAPMVDLDRIGLAATLRF